MRLDLLAVGAHPDDVELFCGGTLIAMASRGYRTGVLSLTAGELGTRGTPENRLEEFAAAARLLQAQLHEALDIPDGRVDSSWENKLKVVRAIRTHRPSVVLAPYWEDRHPDHQNASRLLYESVFLAALQKVATDQDPHRIDALAYYPCWHEFQPTFIVDITDHQQRKMDAVMAYLSQFHHAEKKQFGNEETPVSRPEFLEFIINRARHFGSMIGVGYGEAFFTRGPLPVQDPVAFLSKREQP